MDAYAPRIERMMKRLYDSLAEDDRRRYAAIESTKLGHGGVEYISSVLKCDPKTISGPRWTPNFNDHLNFCMHAKAADANFEDKERNIARQRAEIVEQLSVVHQ